VKGVAGMSGELHVSSQAGCLHTYVYAHMAPMQDLLEALNNTQLRSNFTSLKAWLQHHASMDTYMGDKYKAERRADLEGFEAFKPAEVR